MKISKLKPDKEKPISDPIQKQSRPKEKGIVIGEINYSDINRPRIRSQAKSEIEPKNKGKQAVDAVPTASTACFPLFLGSISDFA